MNALNFEFSTKLDSLRIAISSKNKSSILNLYNEINLFNFGEINNDFLDDFDELIDLSNDILEV